MYILYMSTWNLRVWLLSKRWLIGSGYACAYRVHPSRDDGEFLRQVSHNHSLFKRQALGIAPSSHWLHETAPPHTVSPLCFDPGSVNLAHVLQVTPETLAS